MSHYCYRKHTIIYLLGIILLFSCIAFAAKADNTPQITITLDKSGVVNPEDIITATYQITGDYNKVETARWVVGGGATYENITQNSGTTSIAPGWGGECFFEITLSYGANKTLTVSSEHLTVNGTTASATFAKDSFQHGETINVHYEVTGSTANCTVTTYWHILLAGQDQGDYFNYIDVLQKDGVSFVGDDTFRISNNIKDVYFCITVMNEATGTGHTDEFHCEISGETSDITTDAAVTITLDKSGTVKPGDSITATYSITGNNVQIQQARWVNGGATYPHINSLSGTITETAGWGGEIFFEITVMDNNGNFICGQSEHLLVEEVKVEVHINEDKLYAGDTATGRYQITGDLTDYEVYTYWIIDIWPNGHGIDVNKQPGSSEGTSSFPVGEDYTYISFAVDVQNTKTGYGHWYHDTREVLTHHAWTISFDSNGGSGEMIPTETDENGVLILPDCTFTPPTGMVFDCWSAGNPGDEVAFDSDTVISANWKKAGPLYYTYSGERQVYVLKSGTGCTFIVKRMNNDDKILSFFVEVRIDNRVVDSRYYTVRKGSLILDLKSGILDNLTPGNHTLEIVFTDGSVKIPFAVKQPKKLPKTGDQADIGIWIALIIIGTVGIIYFRKKKKVS